MSISHSQSQETVLVTGASSGIGRELAHRFARHGSNCVLVARSEDALRELADQIESQHSVTASVLTADLSVPGSAEDVVTRLEDAGHSIDVLVNNAGKGARGPVASLAPQQQVDMIQLNVTTLTHLTRLLLPDMLSQNRGGVLNVASTAAFQPGPYMSVYYATKAYVLSFTEGLAEEVADTNVTVTALAPGPTKTPFVEESNMDDTRLFRWTEPMTPEEVADAGYEGFRRDRTLVVPGFSNALSVALTRFAPRPLLRKIVAWLNQ